MLNLKYPPLKALRPKIPLKNIDSSMLGWIRPDKTINFQSEKAAQAFAKNQVIKALEAPFPYEKGILLKQNRVLCETNGDGMSVEIPDLPKKITRGACYVHGHPDLQAFRGSTTPVSLGDYLVMLTNKFDKMIAYNIKGEYNMLEKKPDSRLQKLLPHFITKILEFFTTVGAGSLVVEKYAKNWAAQFPKDLQISAEKLMHAAQGGIFANQKMAKSAKELMFDSKLMKRIADLEQDMLKNGTSSKVIDRFWQENAKTVGVKYSTDFSNLK